MKPEDDEPSPSPSEEELREAAALAHALETDARPDTSHAAPPTEALEAAALLRHARAPLAVPPAHEPIAAAQATQALQARRGRRARRWIAASLLAPAAAAAWLLFANVLSRSAPPPVAIRPPAPTTGLLAAQADAARGGRAALARLDQEMRAYRRQYHDGLRRRGGGAP